MEAHLVHNQEYVGSRPISATRSEVQRPCSYAGVWGNGVLKAHRRNAPIGEEEQKPQIMNSTGLKVDITVEEVAISGYGISS